MVGLEGLWSWTLFLREVGLDGVPLRAIILGHAAADMTAFTSVLKFEEPQKMQCFYIFLLQKASKKVKRLSCDLSLHNCEQAALHHKFPRLL